MKTKKVSTYIAFSLIVIILVFLVVKLSGRKFYESDEYKWKAEIGSKQGQVLIRGKKIDKIKDDINKLIYTINRSEKDPEAFHTPVGKEPKDPPKLKLKGIKGEVVNVEVVNAEYLTQRMRSTGADSFLAEATFTLTEYSVIKHINFIFEEGDHASPGFYSRKDFLGRWKLVEK